MGQETVFAVFNNVGKRNWEYIGHSEDKEKAENILTNFKNNSKGKVKLRLDEVVIRD